MSKCNFSIDFTDSVEVLIQKAQSAITGAGGSFSGDAASGGFIIPTPVGKVTGSYAVESQVFHVSIEDKPIFLTCNKLETELTKYVKG